MLDVNDAVAQGAELRFSVKGVAYGSGTIGDRPVTIHLPNPDTVLDVDVEYGNQTQSARLRAGQDSYMIRFPFAAAASFYKPPFARCPDGTVGQPCVDCEIDNDIVRICV